MADPTSKRTTGPGGGGPAEGPIYRGLKDYAGHVDRPYTINELYNPSLGRTMERSVALPVLGLGATPMMMEKALLSTDIGKRTIGPMGYGSPASIEKQNAMENQMDVLPGKIPDGAMAKGGEMYNAVVGERFQTETLKANYEMRQAQLRALIAKMRAQMHQEGFLGSGFLEEGKERAVGTTRKKQEQMR